MSNHDNPIHNNSRSNFSLLTKLFIKEAQFAQILTSEALKACSLVLKQQGLNEDDKDYLLNALIQNKVLIPSSTHIYLIHYNSTQGILVNFTSCYSPLCKTSQSPCYSPCCPNKSLSNARLTTCSNDQNNDEYKSKIPYFVLSNLNSRERKRQLAIEELRDYEDHFLKQLQVIQDMFSFPLLYSQTIIEEPRKESFHNTLFGNYHKLASYHRKLIKALDAARDNVYLFPTSSQIGHILYDHFSHLQHPYIQYVSNHPRSKYIYALEYARNNAFVHFIEQQQLMERDIRLPLKDLLVSPIVRIGKYELLFHTIAKYSQEDDRASLTDTIQLVQALLYAINEAARESEAEVRLLEIRSNLKVRRHSRFPPPMLPDDATLWMEGPAELLGLQPAPSHLFLFSTGLYMTRTRTNSFGETEYIVMNGKPIPLAMVDICKPARHPFLLHRRWHSDKRTGSVRHRLFQKIRRDMSLQASYPLSSSPPPSRRILHLCHRAEPHITYRFECSNVLEWKKKIRSVLPSSGPFVYTPLCSTLNYSRLQSLHDGRYATGCGKIYCSLPCVTSDGRAMIALGTQYGLWVACDGSDFQQVLTTSCHQLELLQNKLLIIRCVHPKRVLGAILVDQLSPMSKVSVLQRSRVLYFATSVFQKTPILCYLRKRRTGSYRLRLLRCSFHESKVVFTKYKEHKLELLEPKDLKLVDGCVYVRSPTEGVEKIELMSWVMGKMKSSRIELKHAGEDPALTVSYVPLNQRDTALICSPEYAYPIAEQEETDSLQQGIEFESKAKSAVVNYPYLIIFSTHVIEIRHLETTELVQVISGNQIRCIYVSQKDRVSSPMIHISMVDHEQDKTHVYQLYLKEMEDGH